MADKSFDQGDNGGADETTAAAAVVVVVLSSVCVAAFRRVRTGSLLPKAGGSFYQS